jgi:hypothetical protein
VDEGKPKISVFASSVRVNLWKPFFESIARNDLPFEVVFAGNLSEEVVMENAPVFKKDGQCFRYIYTGRIKPAQVYEIARLNCRGELLHWTADDSEYSEHLLDKIWARWVELNDYKKIISCQTIEDGNFVVLEWHRLFGRAYNTPQMAPLGFMSEKFFNEVGGVDRRYISGQWDNDIIMRAMNAGGEVVLFMDKGEISLDHYHKHGGNAGTFRTAYTHDRKILEAAWAPQGRDQKFDSLPFKRFDSGFEPFDAEDPNFYYVSQSHKGMWE